MKLRLTTIISVFFMLFAGFSFAQSPKNERTTNHSKFFSASDAANWIYVIKDKTLDPSAVFKMDNGILQITGVSTGYLRTKKIYTNFDLTVDWRWTKVLGNGGVLVHIQPKDSIWPVCYQVQQKANSAGDIICMNGLWAKECTDSVKFTVKMFLPPNEKPMGEWNTMHIISKNNSLKVFVNGELQNYITGLTAGKGFIGFQNEGKPIEFRNLTIK
ncbi:MAG: DUF1080 domain-containing protein [Paludibacter sp.]